MKRSDFFKALIIAPLVAAFKPKKEKELKLFIGGKELKVSNINISKDDFEWVKEYNFKPYRMSSNIKISKELSADNTTYCITWTIDWA